MGASRETANLWYWLFQEGKDYPQYKRSFNQLFKNPYFWNDSFWIYINRYLICKIKYHRTAQWIDDDNNQQKYHCFSCGQDIGWRWNNPLDDGSRVDQENKY